LLAKIHRVYVQSFHPLSSLEYTQFHYVPEISGCTLTLEYCMAKYPTNSGRIVHDRACVRIATF
jgi:hypothetical protein